MNKPVRWLKAAQYDLNEIVAYIAHDAPLRAERFAEKLLDRVELLSESPESGPPCPDYPSVRQLILGNYLVYYTVHRREVVVRAVVHGARLFQEAWVLRDE